MPSIADAASAMTELLEEIENSPNIDRRKIAAVYREAVLRGESIDRAVGRLGDYARHPGLSPTAQANCNLAIAHLQWRDGAIEAAVESSEKALASSPTPGAMLLKARLLDAGGDEDAARELYQRAADAFGEGDEQWLIRNRLAMMDAGPLNIEALETLVSERGQESRNQAAVVLALLGRPDRSIALYKPREETGRLYQQHMRLSEWALQAESHELARAQAWLGFATAPVRVDRLFALSLLAESYRSAGELDRLIEDLASRGPNDRDLMRLRVETLIETEDYGRAIALYEQLEGTEVDIAERRRLVALYEAAGDTDAMVREYRRMMDREPAQALWYDGLAAHFLNAADTVAALNVWNTFQQRNGDSAVILVEGAGLMLAMGFVDESVAMIERYIEAHGPDWGALMFLFETWLDRGEDEPALYALERLDAFLPADAAERVGLADAYDRLSYPGEAVRVFEAIRDARGDLGYDEQIRLARLYAWVDRRSDALDLWRDIWVGVEGPARRSFAESQLLPLATELGALGEMAAELEDMLMSGAANRNHMNLLVRIYTESGDKLSATEIIDQYAEAMGENEVGRQQLLAQAYRLLEDYPAQNRALRRLYEIDSANRVDHIKNILISLLMFDRATRRDRRFEEIQRWIGALRAVEEETVTGEFEASIYLAAGFADQAVEAYRRALVEQPENSGNLLLLADVMGNSGQTEEAVAILQFFAENAVEDNDFVVAVDGILNLTGAGSFYRRPDSKARNTLNWTRRVILERIARRADQFYLYELLADIAREQGDTESSFVALENSLAEAGLRRPAVLRELLTMATPNAGFGGYDTGAGDIDRQLQYGRRLAALRQQLPPDVYIGIGRSLLTRGEISGAERSLEMIDDITGMIDIDRTKAELFEEAGYVEQSRVFYNRALNVNRDSLELLHKTGFLYEAGGQFDVAFRRYMTAITSVLRRLDTVLAPNTPPFDPDSRQGARGQPLDASVSREFTEHYASLEQGLLLTWPGDEQESDRATAELQAQFDDALRIVRDRSEGNLLPLARYARLDRTARLIRSVGFFLDDENLAQSADRKLLAHFEDDADFSKHLARVYGAAGRLPPDRVAAIEEASALPAPSPLEQQLRLAENRADFETTLQLLGIAGDTRELLTLLEERILSGAYAEGLGYALAMLPEEEFRILARTAVPGLAEDPGALLDLIGSHLNLYLRAEEAAGGFLVPKNDVIALLMSARAMQQTRNPQSDTSGYWGYLQARGNVDDRISYMKALVGESGGNRIFHGMSPTLALHELLKERLDPRQQGELAEAACDYLARLGRSNGNVNNQLLPVVLVTEALPENASVLYRIAEFIADRWPAFPNMRPVLQSVYEDQPGKAYEQLIAVREGLPAHMADNLYLLSPGIGKVFNGPRELLLDKVAAGQSVNADHAWAAYQMEFGAYSGGPLTFERRWRKAVVLDRLRKLDPRRRRSWDELIEAWVWLGNFKRAGEAIAAEHERAPDNESWRLALFLCLISQQRFEEALALASDGGPDLRNAEVLQQALTSVTEQEPRQPPARIVLQLQTWADALPSATSSSEDAAGPLTMSSADIVPGGQDPLERLMDAFRTGDHEGGRNALREAWRGLWMWSDSPYASRPGSVPLHWLARRIVNMPLLGRQRRPGTTVPVGPNGLSLANPGGERSEQRRMLLDAVAEAPYGAAELDRYLRAMPPDSRKGFRQLYKYLIGAIAAGEGTEKRMRELSGQLQAQQIDDHNFTMWMLLCGETKASIGPGELEAFALRAAAMVDPSPYQLLLAARVFAKAGAVGQAAEHYRVVAARSIQHHAYAGDRPTPAPFGPPPPAVRDLSVLIDEVAKRLPRENARAVVDYVLSIARRTGEAPGSDTIFDALVLRSMEKLYPPDELLAQATRRSSGVLELPETLVGVGGAKAAELVRAHARTGDFDRALAILREILAIPEPEMQPLTSLFIQSHRASAAIVQGLSDLYGFRYYGNPFGQSGHQFSGLQEVNARQDRVFGRRSESWPGAEEWSAAVTQALIGWLEGGELHPDQAVQLLLAAGSLPVHTENSAQAGDFLPRLFAGIESGKRPLSAAALMRLAPSANAAGYGIPIAWIADLLENDGLSSQQQLALLGGYVDSENTLAALELFRNLGLDKGLAVQRKLLEMAEEKGDISYAGELRRRIEDEEAARRELRGGIS